MHGIFSQIRTILCLRNSMIINISPGTHGQKQRKSPILGRHSLILREHTDEFDLAVDALNIWPSRIPLPDE